MSELAKRNPNEWQTSIERYDKKLTAKMGKKSVVFTFANTMLYEHAEEYQQFDHAFRANDDGNSGVFYLRDNFKELWDLLEEHQYPKLRRPFPTLDDERIITQFHTDSSINGLEEMLKDE